MEGMHGDEAGNGEGLVVRRRKVRKMIGMGKIWRFVEGLCGRGGR